MASSSNPQYESTLMFQLKGGLYPLTALQLLGSNLALFEEQLALKIQQAPKFFHHAPVVIELQKLNPADISINFKELVAILSRKKLIPVGIRGGHPTQQAAATEAGLAILTEGGKELSKSQTQPEKSAEQTVQATTNPDTSNEADIKGTPTKIITEPVRSGQQVYARGGDLIVLAPVSHGSELLADGHIHIYGPLRGRALAGVTGDSTARIFCQSLEAELISIAGEYKISEDIDQSFWRLGVEISIEAGRLHIRPL